MASIEKGCMRMEPGSPPEGERKRKLSDAELCNAVCVVLHCADKLSENDREKLRNVLEPQPFVYDGIISTIDCAIDNIRMHAVFDVPQDCKDMCILEKLKDYVESGDLDGAFDYAEQFEEVFDPEFWDELKDAILEKKEEEEEEEEEAEEEEEEDAKYEVAVGVVLRCADKLSESDREKLRNVIEPYDGIISMIDYATDDIREWAVLSSFAGYCKDVGILEDLRTYVEYEDLDGAFAYAEQVEEVYDPDILDRLKIELSDAIMEKKGKKEEEEEEEEDEL